MFKKGIAFLIAGLLLIAPAAVPVYGQSCEQGGSRICGPSCGSYSYNILWDPEFVQVYDNLKNVHSGSVKASVLLLNAHPVDDPLNNPNTRLEVTIYTRGVTYLVDAPPGGSQWCNTRHIDLGYHPEWVGQPMWVAFWATIPGNAKISVATTSLWQSRFAE